MHERDAWNKLYGILEMGGVDSLTADQKEALCMGMRALEMQEKLSEYAHCDICEWQEDYDWEENNISEYQSVASVSEFLIGEYNNE